MSSISVRFRGCGTAGIGATALRRNGPHHETGAINSAIPWSDCIRARIDGVTGRTHLLGVGDAVLNYRYQVLGDGDSRMAFAPRVSTLIPTGDVARGRGAGGAGVQVNLPVSVVLHRRLVTHWNAGGTFVPHARNSDHARARIAGYNFGQSFIFVAHPRVNLMVETCAAGFQSVVGDGKTEWSKSRYVSPGIRWAFNFRSGLQIVPGVAVPIGIGSNANERGMFLYLSFEHPFGKEADR